jgi:hypothetical protein
MTNDINESLKERISSVIKSDQAAVVGRVNEFMEKTGTILRATAVTGGVDCWDTSSALTDFAWSDLKQEMEDSILYDQVYDNSLGKDKMTPTFNFSKSYADSHTFSFTEGVKLGAKTTVKASLPYVGEGEVEISAEVSFSAEQSFTYSDTKTWTMSVPVEVMPGTVARVSGHLNTLKQKARFNGKQRVTDGLAMVWVTTTLANLRQPMVFPVHVLLTDQQREFDISGAFDNIEGVTCNITQTSE